MGSGEGTSPRRGARPPLTDWDARRQRTGQGQGRARPSRARVGTGQARLACRGALRPPVRFGGHGASQNARREHGRLEGRARQWKATKGLVGSLSDGKIDILIF